MLFLRTEKPGCFINLYQVTLIDLNDTNGMARITMADGSVHQFANPTNRDKLANWLEENELLSEDERDERDEFDNRRPD